MFSNKKATPWDKVNIFLKLPESLNSGKTLRMANRKLLGKLQTMKISMMAITILDVRTSLLSLAGSVPSTGTVWEPGGGFLFERR